MARKRSPGNGPQVGFFGILGSGNLGNDGSLDAMVTFLRDRHPEAILSFLCMGPEQITTRYGVPATHLQWYEAHAGTATGGRAVLLKVLGKALDPLRTLAWVRHQDVVIVPGMGVLEATLPLRPWATPYALFWLCAAGRLFGTKVALVSVGANVMRQRLTRWLFVVAARRAQYRSYRDTMSRDAMAQMGVDVALDEVYPDLAFALPAPPAAPPGTGAVGVGVMAFYGGNDDRARAGEIHRAYLDTMKRFVRWLVDDGRQVRLFTGDPVDENVVTEILADLWAHRPGLDPSRVIAEPASTLQDLMRQMASVDIVVATRYHNVLCALKLCRPTLSLGYAAKHDVLMADMGLGEFCQSAHKLDLDRIIEQFSILESRAEQLRRTMAERNQATIRRLEQQFTTLSAGLFPSDEPAPVTAQRQARQHETSHEENQ
jgi:polysaccharide pyruvyl transferase WcaK-like protein